MTRNFTAAVTWVILGLSLSILSCDTRCSDRILDVSTPIRVREVSVEKASGDVLWRFRANAQPISRVIYGLLPPNSVQVFPEHDLPPRSFSSNEALMVRVYSDDSFYFIHGRAEGARSLCCGAYEAGHLDDLQRHNRSLKLKP